MVDEDIQNTMNVEDEVLAELRSREREIESLRDAIVKKDTVISEKDQEIEGLRKLLGGDK